MHRAPAAIGQGDIDNPLELPGNLGALVAAVVKANPKTIVVGHPGSWRLAGH